MKRSRRHQGGVSLGTIVMLTFTALVLVSFAAILPTFTGNQDIRIDAGKLAVAMDESLSQLAASTGEMLQSQNVSLPLAVPLPTTQTVTAMSTAVVTATPVPVTPPPRLSFSLCATGSIILNSSVQKALTDGGEYEFGILTDQISGALAADLSIATFENSVIGDAKLSNTNMPAEMLAPFAQAGINALNLGHRDALNSGLDGLKATLDSIRTAGFLPFGLSTFEGAPQTMLHLNGITVAVLSYQDKLSSTGRKQTSEAERAFLFKVPELQTIADDIASVRAAGAQVVVVSLCWGKDGADKPTDDQRKLAQGIADAGADIILGSGTGVLQPVQLLSADRGDQKYHPVLCAYSLGNLMTHDREKRVNLATILLKTSVVYDQVTGCVAFDNLTYTPTYAWRGKDDGRTLYRILLNNGGPLPSFVDANQQGVMERCYKLVTGVMADTGIPMAQ